MITYYYVVNRDGTTRKNFKPFKNDPDYAEVPDWIDDNRICGNALHVVSDNPCNVLNFINRNHPIAHEVMPVNLKSEIDGKFRCQAVKRIRTLSDEKFAKFFMKFKCDENRADLAIKNNHTKCLNKCIEIEIFPTFFGADWTCRNGFLNCLNKCIEVGVLPNHIGANWAAGHGYLKCLNACIKTSVLPDYSGAEQACENGHTNCANRCIQLGLLSKNIVFG